MEAEAKRSEDNKNELVSCPFVVRLVCRAAHFCFAASPLLLLLLCCCCCAFAAIAMRQSLCLDDVLPAPLAR